MVCCTRLACLCSAAPHCRAAAPSCSCTAPTTPHPSSLHAPPWFTHTRAFHELGYDCTTWSPHVYHDLLGQGDGTGEGLVAAYFNTVGWPTFLPTGEQEVFAHKVHALKQEQLRRMLAKGEVPPREDVGQVRPAACPPLNGWGDPSCGLSEGAAAIPGTIPCLGTCLRALAPLNCVQPTLLPSQDCRLPCLAPSLTRHPLQVIDHALAAGARVGLIAETLSQPEGG